MGIKNEKAILSIRPPSEFNADKGLNLKIGQRVNGVCGTVHRDTIVVKNKRGLTVGVIPKNHLSSGISLCAAFMSKCFDTILLYIKLCFYLLTFQKRLRREIQLRI